MIAYSLIYSYHGLCLDKKEITNSELEACKMLLKQSTDDTDRSTIEKEMAQLRIILDLLS